MTRETEPNDEADRPFVDVTLIDAMMEMTPEERLRQNDRMLQTIQDLSNGFAAIEPNDDPRND